MKLHISFCPSDATGTGWHASLTSSTADMGVLRVGPTALLHRLATLTGAPVQIASPGERAAAVVARLEALDDGRQWFSATFGVDPVGAAVALLRVYDRLRELGWDGRPLAGSPRLGVLAALRNSGLPPGLPDAVHALASHVASHPPVVPLSITLEQPRSSFPPVWRRMLSVLEAGGATLAGPTPVVARAPDDTDLGRLQRALLGVAPGSPLRGDGTVRVLSGRSPWEAAAFASCRELEEHVWCLSAEPSVLDIVRVRFGLPALRVSSPSRWRPALQVLPLVLSLQVGPQDAQLAFELLTLPIGQGEAGRRPPHAVPSALRRRLVDALRTAPAVGGPAWERAVEEGLAAHGEKYPDADLAALHARMNTWFPSRPPARASASVLAERCDGVAAWLGGRGASAADPVLLAAASVAREVARALRTLPPDRVLDALQIGQLHEVAAGQGVALGSEAGAGAPPLVGAPECLPAGVPGVVWFGLVAGSAEVAADVAWSQAEQDALMAAGVSLPAPAARRAEEERAWVHAVCSARDELVVVTWGSAAGEPVEAHPLLDLWQARHGEASLEIVTESAGSLLADPDSLGTSPVPASLPVAPHAVFQLDPGRISTSRRWSASAMETLLGCPLRWTFSYAAGLREAPAAELWSLRPLSGTFAHTVFEQVLLHSEVPWPELTPERAEALAARVFDARLPLEAAPLALPERRSGTARLRARVVVSVGRLVSLLKNGGWRPLAAEQDISELGRSLHGEQLSGSIDLLVERDDGTRGVIDLKLGSARFLRDKLAGGQAIQLAFYAAAVGGTPLPPVAYYVIEDAVLLTTDEAAFPGAQVVVGEGPGATMVRARDTWVWSRRVLEEAGRVVARGPHLKDEAPSPEDVASAAGLDLPDDPWPTSKNPCRFCDAKRLCTFSLAARDASGGAA